VKSAPGGVARREEGSRYGGRVVEVAVVEIELQLGVALGGKAVDLVVYASRVIRGQSHDFCIYIYNALCTTLAFFKIVETIFIF
jgi:hypothetical protein